MAGGTITFRLLIWGLIFLPLLASAGWYDPNEDYWIGDRFKISFSRLHPTQMTVGFREIQYRKSVLEEVFLEDDEEIEAYLKRKAGKVMLGPQGSVFLLDGHHVGRALWELGQDYFNVVVEEDWSYLSWKEFWRRMGGDPDYQPRRSRLHLRDAEGSKRPKEDLPTTLADLTDDPLRSVVYFLIKTKVIRKDDDFPYFGEYLIAEKLRGKIQLRDAQGRSRFWSAVREAAYLVSRSSSQDWELPGQRFLNPGECRKKLQKLSKYY